MVELLAVFFGCGAAILLAGFYAGMETAGYAASPARLRYMADRGDLRAGQALGLLSNMGFLVTITLIGHNLAVYLGTYILESHLAGKGWHQTEFWATLILTPFCFLFAETTPKQLGYLLAERYTAAGTQVMRFSRMVFWILAVFLGGVARAMRTVLHRMGSPPVETTQREEILAHLDLGAYEGLLDTTQHRMALHMMAMGQHRLRLIMQPLADVAYVKKSTPVRLTREKMRESGLRCLPLVDKRKHQVQGIITAEKLTLAGPDEDTPTGDLADNAVVLSDETSVGQALAKLQQGGAKLGVVVRGEQAIGIVTVGDLIAEVLGFATEQS